MSLISDPDYLIHSLRLNYLRNVDDPYGPRLISLDPSYDANPYIYAAGLSDVEKWPELAVPSSPAPSDDEGDPSRPGGRKFGATGLKYTTTIMGPSRVGGMGLRVNGKRASAASKNSYRFSIRSATEVGPSVPPGEKSAMEAAQDAPASPSKRSAADGPDGAANGMFAPASDTTTGAEEQKEPQKTISPEFHPRFKGAAEMEARRKLRMLARAQPPPTAARPPPSTQYIYPELSSSEDESEDDVDEDIPEDEDEDEFDMVPEVDDAIDIDGEEFDPDFAASRGLSGDLDMHTDSDGVSIMSGTNSIMSTSEASSMVGSSLPQGSSSRVRSRLSPVREGRHSEETSVEALPERPEESAPIELGFDMVIPAPKADKAKAPGFLAPPTKRALGPSSAPGENPFARRPVPSARPGQSALSAMLAESSGSSSSNPFTELYSAIAARSDSESMVVNVYFPHVRKPAGKPLELKVRKDASVEEVLGFALCTYWEEGWLPKIDEGLQGEEDPKWESRCSAVGWVMRIAEDDGEVDEDFPPPDRTGRISKFNFDAYAVLEASQAQVQQNKVLESKIQRRASRIVIKKKKSTGLLNNIGAANALALPTETLLGTSAGLSSLASSLGMFPSSLGPSTSHGPPQFLRIRIADTADAGHVSTTIQASGGMYMAEVLEAVCQKRKLSNPKDYALVLDHGAMKVYIPLDRTVKSLQGKRDLILMKRTMLQNYGVEMNTGSGRTTDPNASILKRQSEVIDTPFNSIFDPTNAYKKYTVYRKVPMLVTRSARLLAIDGGYLHIIPMSNKAKHVFESGKTSSYHLKSVVACQQSSKNSSTFKLVVRGNAERNKRYDFEAESAKLAAEIVQTIRSLKVAMERPGTIKQSRRSRHVG
ncbi:stress-activated map kinase interacting protein 1-domain-containing protein [Fomitopsis serialis]|uniref:stress-activated map kinase interacting protein 1-domain-containing protein n=1 Tax=Fomitopsis serialis TaxID=139415 RepID=UPI0020074028|nr:stress-activated map kinase interacting protein 1-domain-containing protein [Neoantrodia serialis]KAH9918959.1 stress-activated map kinase interacting protein 1-domain-containing protein [Neoantrodia serialis]